MGITTKLAMAPALLTALFVSSCAHQPECKTSPQQQQQQQPGQAQAAQNQGTFQSPSSLGEAKVTPGTSEIEQQKRIVSTKIVKEHIPTVRETVVRADINRMNARQFTALGFPSEVSEKIVQYRDMNGPFRSTHDLAKVEGVSPTMLDKYSGVLGVSTPTGSESQAGVAGGLGQTQTQTGDTGQSSDMSQSGSMQ